MLETDAKDEETNRQLPFVRREMRCIVVRQFDSVIRNARVSFFAVVRAFGFVSSSRSTLTNFG